MATQRKPAIDKPELKKPENFDLERARATVMRIIQENKEWVREMAAK
jgi:hypothetical protein